MSDKGADRRMAARVPVGVRVQLKDYVRGRVRTLRARDVSSGGLFVRTSRPRRVGETVLVSYPLPGSRDVVRIEGEVVRVADGRSGEEPGMAVAFVRELAPRRMPW